MIMSTSPIHMAQQHAVHAPPASRANLRHATIRTKKKKAGAKTRLNETNQV